MRIPSLRGSMNALASCLFLTLIVILSASLMIGCGSGVATPSGPGPVPGQTTSVTVQLASSSNGRFSAFKIPINGISLTSSKGTTVSLVGLPQITEFSHLNGSSVPVATVDVPQDVYTSATVTYSNANFTYILSSPTTTSFNTDEVSAGVQQATVNLSSPITVSGSTMGLSLDLQESKSVTCSCTGTFPETFSITPTFSLTAVAVSPQPTNFHNGKFAGMSGRINAVNAGGNSLTVSVSNGLAFSSISNGPNLSFAVDGATVYQGVGGLASLNAKTFVGIDGVIQSDGSLRATRIEVPDPAAVNVWIGPVAFVSPLVPELTAFGTQEQGDDLNLFAADQARLSFGTAVFRTPGGFNLPANLPFNASFDSTSIVPGQRIAVSFGSFSFSGPTAVNTLTLMPQTINGTINSISSSGSFTVYTVSLPAYDFIPTLNGATKVTVYTDGSVQMLNSSPLSVGSIVRFNGLLFNDAGTLRMVAGQVSDGVAL